MSFARILGYIILFFYLLAATNGLKRYTKNSVVRAIAKNHVLYGQLAGITALIHFTVNIINGNTSLTGFITLLLLLSTGAMGYLFKTKKNKNFYKVHRVLGPLTLVFILLHIFL